MKLELSRRQALTGLAASTTGTVLAAEAFAQASPEQLNSLLPGAGVCVLTPQQIEGPYYFDPKLERTDITEGKPGVALELRFQVVDTACTPVAGARLDVWHADALGFYSGYAGQGDAGKSSTVGKTFLRGTQFADAGGLVSFRTIYPGWYMGRTTHIHFKVFVDRQTVSMGQMYFPDAISEFLYTNVAPYAERKRLRDTTNTSDGLVRSTDGRGSFCSIKEETDRYVASLVLGVDRKGTVKAERGPPGPPPDARTGTRERPGASRSQRGRLVPGVKAD